MKIGVVFPQVEFSANPDAIREYAQLAEMLGYNHILAYDHVLGANPDRREGWSGPYNFKHQFYEPFVLFSFMAAVTQRIEFTSGIVVLPQRQTALVAKQAATLDVLCGGRFRMGVGIGWNSVEYEALNENFHNRGQRIEEQISLLRKLWTEPLVTFAGRWHQIPDAGLNPLPIRQPIPIWIGGHAEPVLRRVAALADGWMPGYRQADQARSAVMKIKAYMDELGRDMDEIGIEPRLTYGYGDKGIWSETIDGWRALGATHMSLNTMGCGLETTTEHLKAVETFATFLERDYPG